ncbi:hypothetical protein [Legionella bozemanae]|nr:hypothetical protein [Legionella bozemanae]
MALPAQPEFSNTQTTLFQPARDLTELKEEWMMGLGVWLQFDLK